MLCGAREFLSVVGVRHASRSVWGVIAGCCQDRAGFAASLALSAATCPQRYSDHLSKGVVPALGACVDALDRQPAPFAKYLARVNIEDGAGRASQPAALVHVREEAASHRRIAGTSAVGDQGRAVRAESAVRVVEIVMLERVRVAYRLTPPTLRGVVVDVTG